jgi:hypothetical protein
MDENSSDAVIGRLVRERSEIKQQLAFLDAKAGQMARELKALARALKKRPETVVVNGNEETLHAEKIEALVGEYKKLLAREIELNDQLAKLGLDI